MEVEPPNLPSMLIGQLLQKVQAEAGVLLVIKSLKGILVEVQIIF